jgi:CMP-N,N'-diacetyllegionaminic acid synthase
MNNIQFWAVIPARSGSINLKNKNILKLIGKPLIHYSQEVAKKTKEIDKVIFSSDSAKYIKISKKKYPCDIYQLRSKKISGKNSLDITFFKSIVRMLKKKKYKIPKYFVHLRPTCPIRDPRIISKAINIIKKNSSYSSLRSVSETKNIIYKSFVIKNKKLMNVLTKKFDLELSNLPRHMYPRVYQPNSYVDIIKVSNIEKNYLHGKKVYPFLMNIKSLDIDTIDDFEKAKSLIYKKK